LASLGHLSKFQRVSRLCFITAPTSLNGDQPNFARCLAVSWAGTPYFRGLLPPNGILPGAKFTLRSSLAFYCNGSATARYSNSGRQPKFAASAHIVVISLPYMPCYPYVRCARSTTPDFRRRTLNSTCAVYVVAQCHDIYRNIHTYV